MRDGKKIIAVLPAYNAEKTLERTVADIPPDLFDEVILVDDESRDGTVELARKLGLTVIVHERNLGYGGNQKTCYRAALEKGADIVVMIHPDYQYDPTLAPELVAPILAGNADCVLGSRMMRDEALKGRMPVWKYVGNKFLTAVENLVFGQRHSEYHTGYRAYSRKVISTLPLNLNSDGFVFDQQIIAQMLAAGYRIVEVPIPTRYFKEASSVSFGVSVKYGLQTLWTLIRFFLHRKLGMRFKEFRLLALLLAIVGVGNFAAEARTAVLRVDSQDEWREGSGEFIDYWTRPGWIRPFRAARSDDFDGTSLADFWTWSPGGESDSYSLTARTGWLRLYSSALSEWWDEIDKAPKFWQILGGDFDVQVILQDDRSTYSTTFAGLFVSRDSRNRVEIGIGGSADGAIHTRQTIDGVSSDIASHLPFVSPVYLRITRIENLVATYFRNGPIGEWSLSKSITLDNYDSCRVGVYSKDASLSSYVDFDDFRISEDNTPLPIVEYKSRIFDKGELSRNAAIISWANESSHTATLLVSSRTSPEGISWSDWGPDCADASDLNITSGLFRYLQLRMRLGASESVYPAVDWVSIKFLEAVEGDPLDADRVHAVPHPIRDKTGKIQYELAYPVREVILEFLDPSGRRVGKLAGTTAAGINQVTWDTSGLANGVYFLKIKIQDLEGRSSQVVKRLAIVR